MNVLLTFRIYDEALQSHLAKAIHSSNQVKKHHHVPSLKLSTTTNTFKSIVEHPSLLSLKQEEEEEHEDKEHEEDQDFSRSDESSESSRDAAMESNSREDHHDASTQESTSIMSQLNPFNATLKSSQASNKEQIRHIGMPPTTSIVLYPDETSIESSTTTTTIMSQRVTALSIASVMVSAALDIYGDMSSSSLPRNQTYSSDPEEQEYELQKQPNYILPLAPLKELSNTLQKKYVLLLTLQSGRFAAAIFHQSHCIQHTTSTRYTTRKGQGKSQKANDNAKGKAKSIGSQLRRAGAEQLRKDVSSSLKEWYKSGVLRECFLFFISISKTLQKEFWSDVQDIVGGSGGAQKDCSLSNLFAKKSKHVIHIPLDVGRPSYSGCCAIHELLTTCSLQHIDLEIMEPLTTPSSTQLQAIPEHIEDSGKSSHDKNEIVKNEVPLTLMHRAVQDGDIDQLLQLLSLEEHLDDVDVRAGPELQTPLHIAAALPNPSISSKCIRALLLEGRANPGILDGRNRPPYFLASSETSRNVFRTIRSQLQDVWDWDACKVGPALTEDDLQRKKEKAAEKKRKQRERQKERKAEEEAELEKEKAKQEEEAKAEEAKRIRDGLKPKPNQGVLKPGEAICDFCQVVCKRKSQMFQRLEYYYCSTECVKRHQRELMATAATARLAK